MNVKTKIVGIALLLLCVGCGNDSKEEELDIDAEQEAPQPEEAPDEYNGHAYIDLGLSVKWATRNVGASSPEGYGDYFAWGETSPKDEYTIENSVTYEKEMSDITGDSLYDAARVNWGGTWRLPTADEIDELVSNCQWEWTIMEGQSGYEVIGPNGNSIFLPAAGYYSGTSLYGVDEEGYYWSSVPYEPDMSCAYNIYFGSNHHSKDWNDRCKGYSVRPVSY